MIYAVIDTNVLVSALFTSNMESATVKACWTGATNPTLYVDASMTEADWNNGSFTMTAKP